MNKREILYRKMRDHGLIMVNHFKLSIDPVDLYRRLKALENHASGVMDQFFRGEIDSIQLENFILHRLKPNLTGVFGENSNKVRISHAPDGYYLKLNQHESLKLDGFKNYRGEFILAPDFKEG